MPSTKRPLEASERAAVCWASSAGPRVKTPVVEAGAEGADEFARCGAAGYAVKNKGGFVRHVRTLTDKEGGIWRADADYSVTAALPDGVQTIDAEVTVADCAERGIPTGPVAAKDKTAA